MQSPQSQQSPFTLASEVISPGTRQVVNLEMPNLSSQTDISMPVHILHGHEPGPVLLISAALHGDELNGVEIIRRVLASKALKKLKGTLIAVPIVNPYGLLQANRELPDGRDLNRSFPGSERGSLAARLANLFITEIVSRCTHGIDLHTGSGHRTNLPQIRTSLENSESERLARQFGTPVILNAPLRDGTLREAAANLGIPMLLYEAGEALRYNDVAIRAGTAGILNVMRALDMLPTTTSSTRLAREPFIARSSRWTRAPESGLMRLKTKLGAQVEKGAVLGYIEDPGGGASQPILAGNGGVIIGRRELPLVHEGDAVFHIASFNDDVTDVAEGVESFNLDYSSADSNL